MVSSLLLAGVIAGVIALLKVVTSLRQMNKSQSVKLDRIEILVDGRYSEVLQQLADVKKLLAKATGQPDDYDRATAAQTQADRQEVLVNKVDAEKDKNAPSE
jgi:hypothetical protein